MARTTATTRTTATRRISPQNMTKSMNFAASYVDLGIPSSLDITGNAITVCAWFKRTVDATLPILSHATSSTVLKWETYIQPTNKMLYGVKTDTLLQINGSTFIQKDVWYFLAMTYDGAYLKGYINGNLDTTPTAKTGNLIAETGHIWIGALGSYATKFTGKIKDVKIFDRALSQSEIADIYYDGKFSNSGLLCNFTFENDTSTTVYSANDITKTGTITGATFSQDVPVKGRNYSGKNLFVSKIDGSVGISPAGTVSTNSEWIEDERFNWYHARTASAVSVKYDSTVTRTGSHTLKISTTDVTGRTSVNNCGATLTAANFQKNTILVKPSTQYTISCYIKTNNTAATSAYVGCRFYDSNGNTTLSSDTSSVDGTKDWTLVTVSLVTPPKTVFLRLVLANIVAGNVSDAWFDINSLSLTEVIPSRTTT